MAHIFSAGRGASTIYSPGLKIMVGSGELLAGFISKEDDAKYSDAIHSRGDRIAGMWLYVQPLDGVRPGRDNELPESRSESNA